MESMSMMKRFERFFTVVAFSVIAALLVVGQNPAPLGPYANLGFPITTLATQTPTLTANQMVGEIITTFAGATTMTTDTAANLCLLFPQVGAASQNSAGGFVYDLYVKSAAGNTNVIPTAGAGVTIVGLGTTGASSVRHWKVVLNTCPVPGTTTPTAAVTMHSLETSTF
jgi:hypothetical protein